MISRAFSGSFQKFGDSDCAFSASRRGWAVSQSKMPPQQGDSLLDVIDDFQNFGAHGTSL
jgi:hypothetical protein